MTETRRQTVATRAHACTDVFPHRDVYLHAEGRESKSAPKGEFLRETSVCPPARSPSQASLQPIAIHICLGMRKLPIPVSQEELKSEQYSVLQSSTSRIHPELFMRGILKLFMTLFSKKEKRGKEFKGKNLLKTQPLTP